MENYLRAAEKAGLTPSRYRGENAVSKILLCTGKYANTPYYFKSICVNVYCVEELCYLFAANPFLVNADIMDRQLAEWIGRECGLDELSHQLLTLFTRGSQPSVFVNIILDYVNYCSPEQKKKIGEVLQSSAGLNEYERQKKQGDYLLKNRRYKMAIEEYDGLCRRLPETEQALLPVVYHNMGTAYAGLFSFESAARYYKRAYEMSHREESGIQYLAALRIQMQQEEYIAFIAEHKEYHELSLKVEKYLTRADGEYEASEENRMLTALGIYKEEGNVSSYYQEIDKLIGKLKDDYREFVAG